jgi:hypothetical protein
MNYLILFSVIIIAACAVVLLLPSREGFAADADTNTNTNTNTDAVRRRRNYPDSDPDAAGQRNASSYAGSADGTSDHDHLLDTLLQKHDQLAEGFENREKPKTTVSATTTKKNGIASTSANANASAEGDNVSIPVAGCNKNKCVEIGPTATDGEGIPIAFRGNCTNPKYDNSDQINYRIKYCPAFKPVDDTIDDQECENCGYYTYYGVCIKKDPKKDVDPTDPKWAPTPENPSNCDYNDYQFNKLNYGPMPGANSDNGKGDNNDSDSSNDKPKSKQQFKPENVDGNDDNDGNKRKRTASKMGAASSAINHQHQHTGAINVYHHHIHGSHGTINNNNNNNNKRSKHQGYMEPEAGASVLGFL